MTQTAIELRGLAKSFPGPDGDVHAVRGIDLTIDRGEIVALLGPNGAGKTTTLDLVLGLTDPSAGSVRVLGSGAREAVVAGRVAAVLQSGGLLDDLTVRETVRWIASLYPEPAEVDDVLERAGLLELADRRVSKCSGGEQQRLRFALALVPEPDLLVLDEPTAAMDVSARRGFWAAMRSEVAQGRTIVFATHYLEEADAFADRIVLMTDGRVVADDRTERIRALATGRVVQATVTDPAMARRELAAEPGLDASVTADGARIAVRSTDSDRVASLLLGRLGGRELEITTGSLEDAFVQLTGPAIADQETAR